MPDTKITALTAIGANPIIPATFPIPMVDLTDTSMAASGTTKKVTVNQILGAGGTATLASATITGDLTVATDRLKVVTGSTAVQTGATTQLQVGTTSWPSTVIGKSGSRSLFGNTGEVVLWTEAAPAIGNYSTLFVTAKTGAGATTMGGLQIRAGIENASNSDGFVSLWTSNSAAGGFVERYKIDSTGVATWSNVGGVAGTAMTLNSTGLGIGDSPSYKLHVAKTTDGTLGFFRRISGTINPALTVYCNETGNTVGFGTDYAGATSPSITFTTGGSERLRIDGSSSKVSISASTATAADDRLVFSENMGSVNLGSQIVWNNSSFSTPYASIGVSNGAAGSNGTLIFSTCSSIFTNTNTERVRIKPTGQVRFFPLAADPAGAETGDVYYNSVSNKLKCYNGTIWNDLF